MLTKQQLLPADFMASLDSFDFGTIASVDMEIDSDSEFFDGLFPVNQGAETLLETTEEELSVRIVRDCLDEIIDSVVPAPLTRGNSLVPLTRGNSLVPLTRGNSLVPLTHKTLEYGPADPSVFDSETESESGSESGNDSEEEYPDVGRYYQEELDEAQGRVIELEKEVSTLRKQLKRSREAYEEESVPEPPVKRVKTGNKRYGCPFCDFEKHLGCEKRAIKEHMTNGSCPVASHEMLNTPCKFSNVWCEAGDSGFSVIKSMGFDDPYHFVESFRFYKCPGCNFRHNNSAKMMRHMVSNKCINICKEEASAILKEQLVAKKAGNLIF